MGTILTGLLAVDGGLFYGGGGHFLGVQCIGVLAVIAWVGVLMTIVFQVIKRTVGLRVTETEELEGLDLHEHGLPSAYADFVPATSMTAVEDTEQYAGTERAPAPVDAPIDAAVPIQVVAAPSGVAASDVKLSKVTIVCNQAKFEALKEAMNAIGVSGMTVTQVLGCGIQKGRTEYYRGVALAVNLLPKIQVDLVVCKVPVAEVIAAARRVLYTGNIGDGKIFIYDVENVVKIRTGEQGCIALQGAE